jgi:hypothetical protein
MSLPKNRYVVSVDGGTVGMLAVKAVMSSSNSVTTHQVLVD